MRLKARVYLTYAGKEWSPGMLFDAPKTHGLAMINAGEAEPFGLEDPSTRDIEDALENLKPAEPTLPAVPPVTISPMSDTIPALGGTGSFTVTVTGEGESGTWTVDKDAAATWLSVVSPTSPQTVSGTVMYNVTANDAEERAAAMYVNGKTFTVTQDAGIV